MRPSNHLGRFIKECRSSLGYTSRKVEELTRARPGLKAISHSNLLAMEKGTYIPTFDKIVTLAAIFNVPTQQFEDRLKKDMLGEPRVRSSASYESLLANADAARSEGQHAHALELFNEAIAVLLALPAEERAGVAGPLAEARLQAANCRMRLGLLRVAKDDLEEVLASLGTPSEVAVRASFVMAEIYRQLRNHRLALLHARAALEMCEGTGETVLRAKTLNLLANILDDRGEGGDAVRFYLDAIRVFDGLGDRRAVGLISRNLGTTYFRLGEYDDAMRFLEQGLQIARAEQDRLGTACGLVNLARVSLLRDEPGRARELAREAKEIAQAEGYADVLFASVYHLWRVACAEGQSPLARVYADRLESLHRKLEGHTEESEEWERHIASERRSRP